MTPEVRVVEIALGPLDPHALRMLDAVERRRAAAFVFERDRQRYVGAHVCLRLLLARCLQVAPAHVAFEVSAAGKPAVAGAPHLRFNLSHSGERALVALAFGHEVGVDIEWEHAVEDVGGIAERFLAPGDAAALRRLSGAGQQAGFFACWSRSEALIKARGESLADSIGRFDAGLVGDTTMSVPVEPQGRPVTWCVRGVPVSPGYAGAVAAEGDAWVLRHLGCITAAEIASGRAQLW